VRPARTLAVASVLLALACGCNRNTAIGNDREAQLEHAPTPAPMMATQAALANVAPEIVKPETMSDADIAALGGLAGRCAVRLTEVAFTSFVYAPGGGGTIRLNGKLIPLAAQAQGRFEAGGLSVTLRPKGERGSAGLEGMDMIVVLPGAKDELGYSGFVRCTQRRAE